MDNLNLEEKILLILSKLSLSEKESEFLRFQLNKEMLNWNILWIQAIRNKTLGILYTNIEKYNLQNKIPERFLKNARFFYLGNTEKNKVLLKEYQNIAVQFEKAGIDFAPLKGIALLKDVYTDIGARELSDIDILANKLDASKIHEILTESNFVNGRFDSSTKKIKNYDQVYKKLWKMKMNTLLPYVKKVTSSYLDCIKIDISINLDIGLKQDFVSDFLKRRKGGRLDYCDFFIHMCCHLYKEATNAEWIYQSKDLNIIKFCDIREFYLLHKEKVCTETLIKRTKNTEIEAAIFYTLFYLKELYNDGYEDGILQKLSVEKSIVDLYGKNNFDKERSFKKTFAERLFAESNRDELDDEFCERYSSV